MSEGEGGKYANSTLTSSSLSISDGQSSASTIARTASFLMSLEQ
jgi:hypothetical protein